LIPDLSEVTIMAKHTKLKWGYVPLLESWKEDEPDRVTIDGTLILFASGDVVIHNRWFGSWDVIDFPFPGGHAYRAKWSRRLIIRTAGPDRQTLIYQFSRMFWILWGAWYQVVPRIT